MTNYHIIKVTYLGASNSCGSRIKLYSERFLKGKLIPYDYTFNNSLKVALNYLKIAGFDIVGQAEGKNMFLGI